MRAAIFFTPPRDHPLTRAAATWLMRDAFTGDALPPVKDGVLPGDEIGLLTAEPRRYGFHATMKPPFRLADDVRLDDLAEAAQAFCRRTKAARIAALQLERLGPFFALTPSTPNNAIDGLAAEIVEAFDRFRAPPTPAELARRQQSPLTPSQDENLMRWGYPYVMGDFRFHMTLTRPVSVERRADVAESLNRRFEAFLGQPLDIEGLAIFVQPDPQSDFVVHNLYRFGGA